jgi:hypothetical protein
MTIDKWSFRLKKYIPYKVPKDWNIKTYSDDMDEIVNCVDCGLRVKFGETFTSRRYHTSIGFGYVVCANSYEKEIQLSRRTR